MEPYKLSVLYENNQWLAVNKIPGISVEANPHGNTTMQSLVTDYLSLSHKNPYIGIVHRLDRVTSGVLLFAKRKSVLQNINEQFRNHAIQKKYLAVVKNSPPKPQDTLVNWLKKDQLNKKSLICTPNSEGSIESTLEYKLLGKNEEGYLLEVRPLTGKFHQIRVQLSNIGCPILGDEKYGASASNLANMVALHAWQISFMNPTNQEKITIEASLPEQDWWKGIDKIIIGKCKNVEF